MEVDARGSELDKAVRVVEQLELPTRCGRRGFYEADIQLRRRT